MRMSNITLRGKHNWGFPECINLVLLRRSMERLYVIFLQAPYQYPNYPSGTGLQAVLLY